MIRGVGIDVVEVERIERAMRNPRFVGRILTPVEQARAMSAPHVAGRWAAKEAVAKAVSARLRWHDIEIDNDEEGKPFVRLVTPTIGSQIHISISHERGIASAVAVWEEE